MAPLEISVREVKAMLDSGVPFRLIDVRDPDEFAICRLEGAELIPLATLPGQVAGRFPDKAQKILCLCHHGMRSHRAACQMKELGYTDVHSIRGGIEAWSREIDPSVPKY